MQLHVLLVAALLSSAFAGPLSVSPLKEVPYRMVFVSELPPEARDLPLLDMLDPIMMHPYRCAIPNHEICLHDDGKSASQAPTPVNVLAFLEPILGQCVYRLEGWWTYEVCFGKHVRQYHVEKEKQSMEFFLGRAPVMSLSQQSEDGYAEIMKDGTVCDLTMAARTVEIRYACAPDSPTLMQSVKESSSCNYVILITSYILCQLPTYQPAVSTALEPIYCVRQSPAFGATWIGQTTAVTQGI